MLELRAVRLGDRELLFNIFQKMLYEMTQFYADEMDEHGNYHYGHFDEYFTDPRRIAYFIYNEDVLVGFVLLHPYSYFDACDVNVGEFTVFPRFRKRGFGLEAMEQVFARHTGTYEIKYHRDNQKAVSFWHKVTSKYHPSIRRYSDEEEVLCFKV